MKNGVHAWWNIKVKFHLQDEEARRLKPGSLLDSFQDGEHWVTFIQWYSYIHMYTYTYLLFYAFGP
jgi:hypothetical protein